MKVRKRVLTLMLALLALACMAQDSDDVSPDDGADFRTTATLWLAFDGQGTANVNLDLSKGPQSWDQLRSSLAQALRCPVDQLDNPSNDGRGLTSLPKEWTSSQRGRYLKQLAQINQRRLTGKCDAVLARRQGVTSGEIDYGPVAAVTFAVLVAGVLVAGGLITLAGVWLGNSGHARDKRRLLQRFEREHLPVGCAEDVLVGFAPTAFPRIFGSQYHWDSGFLVLAKDRLQFVGEKTRFSLTSAEIDGIVLGRGGPNWWRFERIYVRWKETAGARNGVFNLYLLEPGSMWTARARLRELCQRLQTWHRQGEQYPAVRAELAGLQSPNIGEVTCASPGSLGTLRMNVRIMGYLLPLAVGVGILLHAAIWYLCGTVIVLRLFHSIPYWRYRDTPPEFSPSCGADPASKVRAASASTGDSK